MSKYIKKHKFSGGKIPMYNNELYVFNKYNVIYRGNIINTYNENKRFVRLDETTYTFEDSNNQEIQSAINNYVVSDNISHLDLFHYKIELPFESNEDLDLNYLTVFHDTIVETKEDRDTWDGIIMLMLAKYADLIPDLKKFILEDRNPFNFRTETHNDTLEITNYVSLSGKYNLFNKYTFTGNFYKLLVALLNPEYNDKEDVNQWIKLERELLGIHVSNDISPQLIDKEQWIEYQISNEKTDLQKKQAFVNLCDLMKLYHRYGGPNQNDETTKSYFAKKLNGDFEKDLSNYAKCLLAEIKEFYELKNSLFEINNKNLHRRHTKKVGSLNVLEKTIEELDEDNGISSLSFVILFYIHERLHTPILTMSGRSMDLFPISKLNFVNDLTQNKFVYNYEELEKITTTSEIMSFKYPKNIGWKANYNGNSFSGCCERGIFELIKFISAGDNNMFYVELLPPTTHQKIKDIIKEFPTFEIMKSKDYMAFNKFVETVSNIPQLLYNRPEKYELKSIHGIEVLKYIFFGDANSNENIIEIIKNANPQVKIKMKKNESDLGDSQLILENLKLPFLGELKINFANGHTNIQYFLTQIKKERVMGYKLISNIVLFGIVLHHKLGRIDMLLGELDVSKVTNMFSLFIFYKNFNQPLDSWNVSNVKNMNSMFYGCTNFNQPLDSWNVIKVEDMTNMFRDCTKFNQPLDSWNVSNVKKISNMFQGCKSYNQNLSSWTTKLEPGTKIKEMIGDIDISKFIKSTLLTTKNKTQHSQPPIPPHQNQPHQNQPPIPPQHTTYKRSTKSDDKMHERNCTDCKIMGGKKKTRKSRKHMKTRKIIR